MGKVLVVDDTKNIRVLLTTCLELRGYEVLTAECGKSALEIVKKEREGIDLIFLDIRMTGMSGTEVLKCVREVGISCPVVIMTAFATVKNAIDCTKLGAVAYLQKPFSPDRVNAVLDELNENNITNSSSSNEVSDVNLYIAKAKSLMNQGRYNEAFDNLKNALSIDPYMKEIYYLIAKVNENNDNDIEARRFYAIAELFD